MVISNGFISQSKADVIQELRHIAKGKDIQPIPLPYVVDTMTYFISDIGEVFGSQKFKMFYLTKPLKIEKRYSLGCNIRIAMGNKKYKIEYLQNLMYWTFVAKNYIEGIDIAFRDNNQYNYQLDNIYLKEKEVPTTLIANIEKLQSVYRTHFINVAWYVKFVTMDISFDDAKDIASNAFFELCSCDYPYRDDYFIGIWKHQVKKRALDYIKFKNRFVDVVFDDGEERLPSAEKNIEVIDYRKVLSGNKQRQIIELYLSGEEPKDIADFLDISASSVRSSISRSIQKLRETYN